MEGVMFTLPEVIGLSIGWIFTLFLGFILVLVFKFTPARVFLVGWMRKMPVFAVLYKHGVGEYMVGKPSDSGSAEIRKLGPVKMTEGSHFLEQKSKVPVFTLFAEFAYTLQKEYPAVIQELKEMGFRINNFEDYYHLTKLASDKSYQKEILDSIQDTDEKQMMMGKIQALEGLDIVIKPHKTYQLHNLGMMFPNNISPDFVRAKVINAVTRKVKQLGTQKQLLITGAIAFFIIVIGAIMLFKFFKTPEVNAVCQCGYAGIKSAAQNLTMG